MWSQIQNVKFNEILLTEIGYFNARVFRLEIKVI